MLGYPWDSRPRDTACVLLSAACLLAACVAQPAGSGPNDAGGSADSSADVDLDGSSPGGPTTGWRARVIGGATVYEGVGPGCLESTFEGLKGDTVVAVLAASELWVLLAGDEGLVRRDRVELIDTPEAETPTGASPGGDEPAPPAGVVAIDTERRWLDAAGCPVLGEPLELFDPIEGLARWHDASYRGFVVADRELTLVPLREVDIDGWLFPWSAAVQIIQEQPGQDFIIGGGVLVGPAAILTAAHLGVDETFCYSWGPAAGPAWDTGQFTCNNIAGPAEAHPAGVDVAIVHLLDSEPPPYGPVPLALLVGGEDLYTSRFGALSSHVFADGVVDRVSAGNAFCEPWPAASSLVTTPLVGHGDSGGPAWVGSDLVGLVHGELCSRAPGIAPLEHVFIHLPAVREFIEPVLAPEGAGR